MTEVKSEEKVCAKCSGEDGPELPDDIRRVDPTPLMRAVYFGHIECIDELMKTTGHHRPKKYGYMILWAIRNCQNNLDEVVKSLMKNRDSIDIALHLAVEYYDVAGVEFLVKAGANVNRPDRDHATVLLKSLNWRVARNEETQQEIAQILIRGGADVNKQDLNNNTALHAAISSRYDGCIQMILNAGADVNAANRLGLTAIDLSLDILYPIKPETLAQLLQKGAMLKHHNMFHLFHVAGQSVRFARALLARGADVNIIDARRRNLLFSAWMAKPECIRLFLKEGVFVNLTDIFGMKALQHFLLKDRKNGHVAMLPFAAGEKLQSDYELSQLKEIAPECEEIFNTQCRLDRICRAAVRKHLLRLKPYLNLFIRIPQLPLPAPLADFLLYNMSKTGEDAGEDDEGGDDIDDNKK